MRFVRLLALLGVASCGARSVVEVSIDSGSPGTFPADTTAPDSGDHETDGVSESLVMCGGPTPVVCQCPYASTCVGICPGAMNFGGCSFYCAEGSTCTNSCAGGSCESYCPAGATCLNGCAGGHCVSTCYAGSTCTNSCAGGFCEYHCPPGSRCTNTCTGGECQEAAM